MSCLTPISIKILGKDDKLLGYKSVPCGKCPECLRRKRAQWSHRLYVEFLSNPSSWFITLTYDDDHLPFEGVNKEDVQLFLKRLRKKMKCRYYVTAEYGDKLGRPHYHGIFFFPKMVTLPECVHLIDSSWQNGNIQVGEVNLATINYCSKYSMKFRFDENRVYPNKTFAMMSRKPGIGAALLDDSRFIKVHREDLDPTTILDGFTYIMHRYYQDKMFSKIHKLKINQKIQEKYGNTEKQERNQWWLERYEDACKRSARR